MVYLHFTSEKMRVDRFEKRHVVPSRVVEPVRFGFVSANDYTYIIRLTAKDKTKTVTYRRKYDYVTSKKPFWTRPAQRYTILPMVTITVRISIFAAPLRRVYVYARVYLPRVRLRTRARGLIAVFQSFQNGLTVVINRTAAAVRPAVNIVLNVITL